MPRATTAGTSLKALIRFPFAGPGWQSRLLIGSGLVLAGALIATVYWAIIAFLPPLLCLAPFALVAVAVPLVPVLGYALRIMAGAVRGEEPALPAWGDWGGLAGAGLRGGLVSLGFLLPGIVAYAGGMALYFGLTIALSLASSNAADAGAVGATLLGMLALLAILFLAIAISTVLVAVAAALLPVALAHAQARGQTMAAFRIGEWWPVLRADLVGWLLAWVVVAGVGCAANVAFVIAMYSGVLCCLAPLIWAPAGFYLAVVGAALFGHTYREAVAALARVEV
jgi:hypothetical protein